jgi:hypothetical protein
MQVIMERRAVWMECLEPRLHLARPEPSPAENVLFRLPLAVDTTTHFYFDRDTTTAAHAWDGTTHTYDGHTGSDFSGGPRGKPIYAAADGILTAVVDGFGDQEGTANGNYVRVNHGNDRDGKPIVTWYLHMTAGTPTTKPIGSLITAGEQIGGVGTSGNSTGFHLHFHAALAGAAFDPFAASGTSEKSWWVNQGSGSPSTTANTSKFVVGDIAEAYELVSGDSLNVRSSPAGSSIGTRSNGMTGTVMQGPVYAAFNNDIDNSLWVWYRIHWSDGLDGWSVQNWLRKSTDLTPPTVASSPFLFETSPHRMTITFSEDVGSSLVASDFVVTNQLTGAAVSKTMSYTAATRTATLNFGSVLPDGNYQLRVPAGSVSDGSGNGLAADYTSNFFVLTGDANRDHFVDTSDFDVLSGNFGLSGKTFSQGDFTYDGTVDTLDFNALARKFGLGQAPAALSPAAAGESALLPAATVHLADQLFGTAEMPEVL